MTKTRWVATFKKNLACLAKITLEKHPGPGDYFAVKSRDVKLGSFRMDYTTGNLVEINDSALYISERDALAFLAKGSDDIANQVTQDAAMIASEYAITISNLRVQARLAWRMHAAAVRQDVVTEKETVK